MTELIRLVVREAKKFFPQFWMQTVCPVCRGQKAICRYKLGFVKIGGIGINKNHLELMCIRCGYTWDEDISGERKDSGHT